VKVKVKAWTFEAKTKAEAISTEAKAFKQTAMQNRIIRYAV